MQAGSVISLSPSFNSYSNRNLVEIAARVVGRFDSDEFYDEIYYERREDYAAQRDEGGENSDCADADGDKEFEFAFVTGDSELSSPIAADEIFHDGKIRPVYPVFDRDLLLGRMKFQNENEKENCVRNSIPSNAPTKRLPLRKLFIQERETTMTTSSSSSSEAEELDGIPAETYCVWRPKTAEEEERRWKKSSSTRSKSKKWKFKDLLDRSNSHGSKDGFVFLTHRGRKKENEKKVKETPVGGGKVKPVPPPYNRDGGEKQRSYLPYKQDLVGFFGNVNGLSKNLQPF